MNLFTKFATLFTIPLMMINFLGGVVSFIWLAVLGEWGIIGYGIASLIISTFCIGIAMWPGLLLGFLWASLYKKGYKFGAYLLQLLSLLHTFIVLSAWCLVVLFIFTGSADSTSFIPVLLWSYGIATAPIASMAQKEQNIYAFMSAFFAQISYIIIVLIIIFSKASLADASIVFGIIMAVGLIIEFSITNQIENENHNIPG